MVKNSCGISVITFQEAAEAFASLDVPCPFTDPILGRQKQDHVALALVISLRVEMILIRSKSTNSLSAAGAKLRYADGDIPE